MNKEEFQELEKQFNEKGIFLYYDSGFVGMLVKKARLEGKGRVRILQNKQKESSFNNDQIEFIKNMGGKYYGRLSTWFLEC